MTSTRLLVGHHLTLRELATKEDEGQLGRLAVVIPVEDGAVLLLLDQHVSVEADELVLVVHLKSRDGAAGVHVTEVVTKPLEHLVLW